MFKKDARILFQGDSITDGNRGRDEDLNHIMGHGYQYIIAAKLGAEYAKDNYHFFNRGISGHRTTDLYGRWDEDTLMLHPDVLSILAGVNDVGHADRSKKEVDPKKFEKVYRLLIEEALEQNPDLLLVLCEPFVLPVGIVKEGWEFWRKEIDKCAAIVKKLASEYNCVFVALQEEFDKACELREPEYWIWDGVHPTTCGHELIAKKWLKTVEEHLKTLMV